MTLPAQHVTIMGMTSAAGFSGGGRRPADTLAHRLILVREEMGWSQRKAAEECGLGFGEWQSMENGAKARGLDVKVGRIAARTGYDPVWLMWGGALQQQPPTTPNGGSEGQPTVPKVASQRSRFPQRRRVTNCSIRALSRVAA